MNDSLVELRNVSKTFGGSRALDEVSLALRTAEIRCLAGENGCGKSTVIKIISGVYQPDDGEIWIDGHRVPHMTPIEAVRVGVEVIYQDFSLFGNLTVAENLSLNTFLRERRRLVDWGRQRRLAREALDRLGVDIDLDAEVARLPTASKQLIAVARALMADARLIIMDEPTTALTRKEVDRLIDISRAIKAAGVSVLFVTHKIREMLEISDAITVMRNGRVVVEGPIADFDEASIVRHMTGRELSREIYVRTNTETAPRLQVKGLRLPDGAEPIDLSLYPGDILGVGGLIGSGRTELALALFGMQPDYEGEIAIDGEPVELRSIAAAVNNGVAYVPEDRLTEGLFLPQSIERNMLASSLDDVARPLSLDFAKAETLTRTMLAEMRITARDPQTPVINLSGGNQQRVVIARWLLTHARILVLNGPTVGVDVGSKAEIHRLIRALAVEQGVAVLMISDDIPELLANCNTIALMHRGAIVARFSAGETDEAGVVERLKALA
ncbi:MAG: sugar ABC transporter ATP-binding protein [Hyphomicrobiales bacterium]|nr:sugar ABC transporter ATP-binding protein [Hyphomicrobiales bacterium]MBV8664076.1 sugar ABC transporter ATP-binding protein [Hyphomicrobiales bacterium]